jgi:hypothetical protein
MNKTLILAFLPVLALPAFSAAADPKPEQKIWTDPETAAAERMEFGLQGEYEGEDLGIQVADINDGKFLVTIYKGGLPGAGWDTKTIESAVLDTAALTAKVEALNRVERKSPTLGAKAPEGAVVVFTGEANDQFKGHVEGGFVWAGSQTTVPVGDFTAHIEFRLPYKPGTMPSSQDRGNSGVYIFNNYECQVLDSFALPLDAEKVPFKIQSDPKQWCGSFYKFKLPDTPMALPPLQWQTYDIDFTAPRFEGDKKVKNARITVKQNGVMIHDDVEMPKGTGAGGGRPEKARDVIHFQGHGNPTAFRNIWIVER